MLLLHLSFAVLSIIVTTIAIIMPSTAKLLTSKLLALGTLITGTVLVVVTQSSLLSSCVSGLIYLAIVSSGVFVATRRLAINNC